MASTPSLWMNLLWPTARGSHICSLAKIMLRAWSGRPSPGGQQGSPCGAGMMQPLEKRCILWLLMCRNCLGMLSWLWHWGPRCTSVFSAIPCLSFVSPSISVSSSGLYMDGWLNFWSSGMLIYNQCSGNPMLWDLILMHWLQYTPEWFLYLNSASQNTSCLEFHQVDITNELTSAFCIVQKLLAERWRESECLPCSLQREKREELCQIND